MDIPATQKFLPLDLANGGAGKRALKPLDLAQRPTFPLSALELGRHDTPDLKAGSLAALQAVPVAHEDARKQAQTFVSQAFFGTLLKQMRNSPFKSELFSGGRGGEAFGSLYDQQLADRMATGVGTKLVDSIVRKLQAAKAYRKTSKDVIERSGRSASAH
ncbi:MAG TPA: rod-binding protein [Tepidisphaeraceae bacterium]|nr:rod-binding protein [Tepidisphaeraceae bacterium]